MPVAEAWLVSPTHCPRCRAVSLPWACKQRLHTACNYWVGGRILSKRRREKVLAEEVQGKGEISRITTIRQSLSHSDSLLEIYSTLEKKGERMKEMLKELRKLDMIVEVQRQLTILETLFKMKKGLRKMQEGSDSKRKRNLSKSTEKNSMEVVHVEEDNKVDMSEEHEHVGSVETDVVSKVNLVSHIDGESKKKGMSDRKTIIGGKTTQCSPDNIMKKISDKMRKMSDIKRQEAVIEEKEAQLRKIVKRRRKIEEKERDCLAEMRDVRKRLKILKRNSGNQKRC